MSRFIKYLFSINPMTLTVGITLMVMVLFLTGLPILDLVELKTYDLRFLSRGRVEPSPEVVIAVIDEKSLDEEGRWPWPRSKIAALIDTLSRNGVRVVGIDIGFLEPDENSEIQLMDRLDKRIKDLGIRNEGLDRFISRNRREADNDLILAGAIENADAEVVLGYFFYMSAGDINFELTPEQIDEQLARIEWARYPLVIYEDPDMETAPFLQAYAPQANLGVLSQATDSAGYFNMTPDADGVVRWSPLIVKCGENLYPPFPSSVCGTIWTAP